MKTLCVLAFTPAHVINAFAAVTYLHQRSRYRCIVVLCRFPGHDDDDAAEMEGALRSIISAFDNVCKIANTSDEELARLTTEGDFYQKIRTLIGEKVDEIYFSHDVVGILYQSVCLVNPSARRICYADGFGFVSLRAETLQRKPGRFERLKEILLPKPTPISSEWHFIKKHHFIPHLLCTALPIDLAGKLTSIVPVEVVPRNHMINLLDDVAKATGISTVERDILAGLEGKYPILLLMTNWHEVKATSKEGEIDLYVDMVTPLLRDGAVVIAKNHPGSSSPEWKIDRLADRLRHKASVQAFPSEMKRYPLELFKELLIRCDLAGYSSVVVTAKYLYDIEKHLVLSKDLLHKHFSKETIHEFGHSMKREAALMSFLDQWDRKSAITDIGLPAFLYD